jgi:hypothetical protein
MEVGAQTRPKYLPCYVPIGSPAAGIGNERLRASSAEIHPSRALGTGESLLIVTRQWWATLLTPLGPKAVCRQLTLIAIVIPDLSCSWQVPR